jgi:hypothetical protein
MKKISVIIIAFLFTLASYAQSQKEELDMLQSLFGMQKKEWVAQYIELNDTQKNDFWILYDEYETKRKEYGQKKFGLLMKYVNDYGEIKAANAESFMKDAISLRKNSEKLVDSYYKKIKKKTDPVVAMQFYQIENYISNLIRSELLEDLFVTKQ